jgi:hypothetical protein
MKNKKEILENILNKHYIKARPPEPTEIQLQFYTCKYCYTSLTETSVIKHLKKYHNKEYFKE